jgi:hypothetical protein
MGTARLVQAPCQSSLAIIDALVNTGYRFVQWNDGNNQNPRTLTVTKDTAFTAVFAVSSPGMFNISVFSNNTNMGSVTGTGDYAANTPLTITATPRSGYLFVQWTDGNTDNPRSITVTRDSVFTAIFTPTTQNMFNITVTSNNTSMGTVTGSGSYAANAVVTITATPYTGYRFVQWNDGNMQSSRNITVTSDSAFQAEFAVATQGMFHVTVNANNTNMGSVTGGGDYAANTVVTITATPHAGYRFVQWNDGNMQSSRNITVTQDTVFTATFSASSQNTYQVIVISNDKSKGAVTGSGNYAPNSTISIGAIANQDCRFVQWDDGNTDNPRVVTVTQDTTFVATFESGTGITDIETSTINIYPNPAKDNIHIVLPENVSRAVFTLYDMQGKALIQREINGQDEVSVSHVAAGIYIYSLRTEKESYTGKIIRK